MNYWTTKDGKQIPLKDLSDTHLLNIYLMIQRNVTEIRNSFIWDSYLASEFIRGDMAQYYAEQDIEHMENLSDEEWLCEYYPIYESIKTEIIKKFGKIYKPIQW